MMNSSPDQTADLWLRIDQLHLNYLKSENNTKKLDIRKKLEGYVRQYLFLVPQDRKFCSNVPSEIIWQSARWIPNFSALKAASAFEAIEKYAANLINQPWRREYKVIKQYGGFYKHHVENCLSGAEKLFHQLGYISSGQETLELNEAVDQDRATIVARDCILAYVECQIVVSIVQRVSAHFPCTWEEALDFRRDHIGTTEQAVRALIYLKNQNRHQNPSYNETSPAMIRSEIPMINQTSLAQTGISYPTNQIRTHNIQNSIVPTSNYFNHSANTPMHNAANYHEPNSHTQQNLLPDIHGNINVSDRDRLQILMREQNHIHPGYHNQIEHSLNFSSFPNGQSNIPTANLLDLQGPPSIPPKRIDMQRQDIDTYNRESSSSSGSTLPGQGGPIPLTVKQFEDEQRRKSVLEAAGIAVSQGNKNASESWDYVYRQLENSGYSKDQADRPDVLELLIKQLQLQKEQQQYSQGTPFDHKGLPENNLRGNVENSDALRNGLSKKQTDKTIENSNNLKPAHPRPSSSSKAEKHDKPLIQNRSSSASSKHKDTSEKSKGKSIPHANGAKQSKPKSSSYKHNERDERYNRPLHPPDVPSVPPKLPPKGRHLKVDNPSHYTSSHNESAYSGEESEDKWECQFCTFLNDDSIDICEMCAKSRLVSESSRTTLNSSKNGNSHRSQSALSHNSRQTPTHGSSNAYYSDEDFRDGQSQQDKSYDSSREDQYSPRHQIASSGERVSGYDQRFRTHDTSDDGIECNRCTLVNDKSLRVCEACGASLGLEPIDTKHTHSRRTKN